MSENKIKVTVTGLPEYRRIGEELPRTTMDVEILLNEDGDMLQDPRMFAINTANAYNCIEKTIYDIEHTYVELKDAIETAVEGNKKIAEIDTVTACNVLDIFYNVMLVLRDGKM